MLAFSGSLEGWVENLKVFGVTKNYFNSLTVIGAFYSSSISDIQCVSQRNSLQQWGNEAQIRDQLQIPLFCWKKISSQAFLLCKFLPKGI